MSDTIANLPAGADALAYAQDKPDVALLQQEYDNAFQQGTDRRSNAWSVAAAEDARFNRWPGQSWDGVRHSENMPAGKECRPYEGAPDTRPMLIDETITATVDILFAAFFGARMNPRPVHATRMSTQEAAEWRAILNWMMQGPLAADLINQVEFLAQCAHSFGWCVLHPTWEKEHAMEMQHLTMNGLQQFAAQSQAGSIARQLPAMVMASGGDGTAANNGKEVAEALAEIFEGMFDGLDKKDAKQLVKDLRTTGEADFPLPKMTSHGPRLYVLVPGIDFIYPTEMTDVQKARVLFMRWPYTAAEIDAKVQDEGWDPDFCEAVKSTAGTSGELTNTSEQQDDQNMRNIEIVTSFAFQNKNGVPGIYCTVFSPNLRAAGSGAESGDRSYGKDADGAPKEAPKRVTTEGNLCAKHFLLDMAHRTMPFIAYQTEVIGKRPDDSRGIAQQLIVPQREMKRYRDALGIRAEMETTPPIKKVGARASKLPPEWGPAAVVNVTRVDDYQYMETPTGNPTLAFELFNTIKQERDEQFGIPNPKVHPTRWQARQRKQVMRWLKTWGQALWQLSVLAYTHLSPEELTEVIGHPPMLSADRIMKFTLAMEFDVRTLDPDWMAEVMERIAAIVQLDTGGTVDRNKLVGMLLSYVDSTLADEVTTDVKGAAKAVFDNVRNEVAQIMLGNEADYADNDPTAKMKLQFLQKVIAGNPNYVALVHPGSKQFNQRTAMLLQKYADSLKQSAVQQDNKLVGRIGVKPVAMDPKAQGQG